MLFSKLSVQKNIFLLLWSYLYNTTSLPCKRCFAMSREFLGNANSAIIIIHFVKSTYCQYSVCKCRTFFVLLFGARITNLTVFQPVNTQRLFTVCCGVRGRVFASHTGVRRFDSRGGDCLLLFLEEEKHRQLRMFVIL